MKNLNLPFFFFWYLFPFQLHCSNDKGCKAWKACPKGCLDQSAASYTQAPPVRHHVETRGIVSPSAGCREDCGHMGFILHPWDDDESCSLHKRKNPRNDGQEHFLQGRSEKEASHQVRRLGKFSLFYVIHSLLIKGTVSP